VREPAFTLKYRSLAATPDGSTGALPETRRLLLRKPGQADVGA
jgi:hypothetical protein